MQKEKMLVLIVDDDPKNLQYLGSLLREEGLRISFASDGNEALKLLEKIAPDIILLDVMMPGMDGYEVCSKIKANENIKEIPVIFLTGQTKVDDIIKGFETGAVDYVAKPFNPKELLTRVRTQLEIKHSRDLILNYNSQLKELNDRLESELNQAATYLRSLLPEKMSDRIRADWKFIPSAHLGGDSFSYNWLNEDEFSFYLIDVSGHGVGAALLSTSVLNILKSKSLPDIDFSDPSMVLSSLNNKFHMEEHEDKFFTLWYGVINLRTMTLTCSSAFHPPAILISDNNLKELGESEIMIGAFTDSTYNNCTYPVERGNRIFLYSDGCFEIKRTTGDMLKFNDYLDVILKCSMDNKNTIESIYNSLSEINNEAAFNDDYSMVEIEIL